MEITITVKEICDKHLWEEACDILGINEWSLNEGQIDYDEILTVSEEQARKLGLLPAQTQANNSVHWTCAKCGSENDLYLDIEDNIKRCGRCGASQ